MYTKDIVRQYNGLRAILRHAIFCIVWNFLRFLQRFKKTFISTKKIRQSQATNNWLQEAYYRFKLVNILVHGAQNTVMALEIYKHTSLYIAQKRAIPCRVYKV